MLGALGYALIVAALVIGFITGGLVWGVLLALAGIVCLFVKRRAAA